MMTPLLAALVLSQAGPVDDATAKAQVAAVLDQLNAASTAADGQAYFALFTPQARFVGTDAVPEPPVVTTTRPHKPVVPTTKPSPTPVGLR